MRIVISGIPIDVQKKNIKHMHLQVKPPDGHVVISAPLSVDDKAIEAYVRTQLGFIKRTTRPDSERQVSVRSPAKISRFLCRNAGSFTKRKKALK